MVDKIRETKPLGREDAIDILDRVIGFVNNCDNKAAIMLGVFCAIVALVFSTDGVGEIKRIIGAATANGSIYDILFLLLWVVSSFIIIGGICYFLMAIVATIDCSGMEEDTLELDSKIYFADISKNETYQQYKKKLLSLDEEVLLNDIISQIYINSCICTAKFKRYNKGLKLSFIGYGTFIALWAIGSYLF